MAQTLFDYGQASIVAMGSWAAGAEVAKLEHKLEAFNDEVTLGYVFKAAERDCSGLENPSS